MGQTPSLTGLELSILLYLHGDFERSDEEIMAECHGIIEKGAQTMLLGQQSQRSVGRHAPGRQFKMPRRPVRRRLRFWQFAQEG